MQKPPVNPRTRQLALLLSSAIDILLGAVLILAWLGILPIDLAAFDLPHWVVGVVGFVFFFSGTVVFAFQLSRLQPPE